MRSIYILMFVLFSFIGNSQSKRNIYEEATQRDMQKISKFFSVSENQKEALHDFVYKKYKFYYGLSEPVTPKERKDFENQLKADILVLFNLSEDKLSINQKKALQDLVIYKTEF